MSDEEFRGIDKVQVMVFLDFSEESDQALHTVWSVAEELLDKNNIWVEVIPVHMWLNDPINMEYSDLPKIVINGKTMFIGRSPTRRELVDAILDRIGKGTYVREEAFITAAKIWDQGFLAAAVVEA